MGRAFEYRKARKFKRWDAMAKAFTKFGREIAMAVKQGGGEVESNSKLRAIVANAKAAQMPKDRIEAAIKRASSKDEKDYQEVVYEGYGPYGVPILVECATDNPTRTVANVRLYFNRGNGQLGKTGSLDFIFDRKGVFEIKSEGLDLDELELEMIDSGLERIEPDNERGIAIIYTDFQDFGKMQKFLEEKGIEPLKIELQRIPNSLTEIVDETQIDEVLELIDKFEEDDDVTNVFHNLQ